MTSSSPAKPTRIGSPPHHTLPVCGQHHATSRFHEKPRQISTFFSASTRQRVQHNILAQHGVRFVFVDDRERMQTSDDPARAPLLSEVHRNEVS